MSSPPDESVPAAADSHTQIATGLARLSAVLRQDALQHGTDRGISATQQQILTFLAARPAGSMALKDVAAHIGLKMPAVSRSVTTLADKGLVRKETSKIDARATVLRLTRTGSTEARRAAGWPDALLGALQDLDAQERAAMLRMLTKMIRRLQQDGVIPPQRMCVDCRYFRPNAHGGGASPHHCDYVDAAFGDAELRLDCREQEPAAGADRPRLWSLFVRGSPT